MGFLFIKYLGTVCVALSVTLIVKIFVLHPLLRAVLGVRPGYAKTWQDRVELRYQNLRTSVWLFAWFKLRLDPMFRELPEFLKEIPRLETALDLGCGFGVAGSSLLEWRPEMKLYGVDPNPKRVRAASLAYAERGGVFVGAAPDFETQPLPDHLDAVFFLDVIHFLDNAQLDLTLRRIRAKLNDGGHLLIRASMFPAGSGSLMWKLYKLERKFTGGRAWFRSAEEIRQLMSSAGFTVVRWQMSGVNSELFWFFAATSSEAGNSNAQTITTDVHESAR